MQFQINLYPTFHFNFYFYVTLHSRNSLSAPTTSYIRWDQFIIVQFTLPKPYHRLPSKFILIFKGLNLNLFNIVTLLTLKVVLGDQTTRPKTILTILKSKWSKSTLKETGILLSQLSVHFQNIISLSLSIINFVVYLLPVKNECQEKG